MPGNRPGCPRWPGCRRRPAPAPAAARPASPARSQAACRSGSPVRSTRNPAATSVSSTGTSSACPRGHSALWLVISTRPGPAGGRNASTDARSGALSKISSHCARERGEHSVHRRHRIPGISDIPGAELGCQLTEPVSQHRRILGGELPGHPDLGQVTVRVRQRHAGLPGTSKSAQGHRPRPRTIAAGQPGVQVREQILAPGQERRRAGQPHRLAGDPWALLHHLAYRGPAAVGEDGARPPVPGRARLARRRTRVGRARRRHVPVDHPGSNPATISADVHIPPSRHRMISR